MASKRRLREGFLTKRGESVKSWKLRFMTLDSDGWLKYYKTKDATKSCGEINLKADLLSVKLATDCACEWPSDATLGSSFGLETKNRTYYMFADTENACKSWKVAIESFLESSSNAPVEKLANALNNQKLRSEPVSPAEPVSPSYTRSLSSSSLPTSLPPKSEPPKQVYDYDEVVLPPAGGSRHLIIPSEHSVPARPVSVLVISDPPVDQSILDLYTPVSRVRVQKQSSTEKKEPTLQYENVSQNNPPELPTHRRSGSQESQPGAYSNVFVQQGDGAPSRTSSRPQSVFIVSDPSLEAPSSAPRTVYQNVDFTAPPSSS